MSQSELDFEIHRSELDNSVNYSFEYEGSLVECRFVQRDTDQIIAYLSSQNGCNKSCRFCWLTQTGQTSMVDVTPELFVAQLDTILWQNQEKIKPGIRLNVNFMARGEPLANEHIIGNWPYLAGLLLDCATLWGVNPDNVKLNLSTIIPRELINEMTIQHIVENEPHTWIYWSYYSHQMAFRKRWMPKAANVSDCLEFLGNYPRVVIHSAFIHQENDQIKNLKQMLYDHPNWKMNIVRYNPYSEAQGEEAHNIDEIQQELAEFADTHIVPRVGFDVKASCGMFLK
jgi:adenine C2-methylase RlmN of 23S rRNA A2503 and tRNA A37